MISKEQDEFYNKYDLINDLEPFSYIALSINDRFVNDCEALLND